VIWLTMHGQNAFINTDSDQHPAAADRGRADHRDPAAAVRLGRAPDPPVGAGPAAIPVADLQFLLGVWLFHEAFTPTAWSASC
jgi:chloramphenicol-sensitive protein RarD